MIGSRLLAPMQRQTERRLADLSFLRESEFDDSIDTRNVQNAVDAAEVERAIMDEDEELLAAAERIPDEVIAECAAADAANYLSAMTAEEADALFDVDL